MSSARKSLLRLAASPRTSLACIGAAAAAALAGFFLPSAQVYSSPWFLSLALLSAGLLAHSVRLQLRAAARRPRPAGAVRLDEDEASVAGVLVELGYAPAARRGTAGERVLFFEKGRAGRWGSAVFHAGLLLAIAAGLWVYAASQRAFLQLMEGETFRGGERELAILHKGPLAGRWSAPFGLRLERFRDESWEDGAPKSYESVLTILQDGRETVGTAAPNRPLSAAGVDVYQSNHYGYVVSLALRRGAEHPVVANFLLDQPPRPGRPAVGGSDFPRRDWWIDLRLQAGRGESAPALEASVVGDGRELYRGPLALGGGAVVGGERLTWVGLRRWSGLILARQPGARLAYLAFALSVAGGALMVLFPHRELRVERDGRNWRIAAVSRAEAALAEEEAAWAQAELARREADAAFKEAGDGRPRVA